MGNRSQNSRRLDARDLKILEIIQAKGRIPKKTLADSIGISLTPCFQRLRRLEKEGFIRGYRGVVAVEKLGSFVWVYTQITLARHRAVDFVRFEATVRQLPEVIECDAVGGGIDYILKLVVRDVNHYQCLMDALLEGDAGIDTYFTYIVTKRIKDSSAIPIAMLTTDMTAGQQTRK